MLYLSENQKKTMKNSASIIYKRKQVGDTTIVSYFHVCVKSK